MKRQLIALMMLAGSYISVSAQTNLAGRTYYNANIMADAQNEVSKDFEKQVAEARNKGIAEAEKKKGRKLNEKELAELDKKIKDTTNQFNAVKKGTKCAITVEFKDTQKMVLKAKMDVSDEALKAAGYGWVKRKAMKAAMAIAPSSQNGTYIVKGNMVIMTSDDKEKDTLRLSEDGKYLSGKFDKQTSFKLKRTK